jgi:putative tryptophan/tyrosine transport system substrate-binding protein
MTIRRREFMTLLGGAATWPVAARAQQTLPVIGYLSTRSANDSVKPLAAFRQGLKEADYIEGRNAAIEFRWADGQYDRLPALAADLVRRQVAVIVAAAAPAAVTAKAATAMIPIVFEAGVDPVALGLVASLNRPGGNATGVASLNTEVEPKRLELLHELVPKATIVAILSNPTNPSAEIRLKGIEAAARSLGLQLYIMPASSEKEIDAAFAAMIQKGVSALMIAPDPFFNGRSDQLAELALRHSLPAIYQYREFAAAGGLMSYGGSVTDNYRLIGAYAGRILKGAKPSDLPVQQATKVELILNLKTAKALGLTVPPALLARADQVIE